LPQLSLDGMTDDEFLCDKAAVLRETTKETPCAFCILSQDSDRDRLFSLIHSITQADILNNSQYYRYSKDTANF
jgi:hypothetical protein